MLNKHNTVCTLNIAEIKQLNRSNESYIGQITHKCCLFYCDMSNYMFLWVRVLVTWSICSEMSGQHGLRGYQCLSNMSAPGNKWRQREDDEEKQETKKKKRAGCDLCWCWLLTYSRCLSLSLSLPSPLSAIILSVLSFLLSLIVWCWLLHTDAHAFHCELSLPPCTDTLPLGLRIKTRKKGCR